MPEDAVRPRSRLRRWLVFGSGGFGVALAVAAGLTAWLALTGPGARFVIGQAVAVAGGSASGVEGSLAGPLSIESLEIMAGTTRMKATRLALDWSPLRLLAGELRVNTLHADLLEVESEPSSGPAREPRTLVPPVDVFVAQAGLDRLVLATRGEPKPLELRDLSLKLSGDRAAWIVGEARATTPVGRASASGSVGVLRPFALAMKGALEGVRGERPYGVTLEAQGPLAGVDLAFSGEEGGLEGGGRARLAPFERTPLRSLAVKLSGLDLSAFAAAPRTKLSIEAELAPAGDLLLAGPLRIANAAPGSLDADRIPVTSAVARLAITTDGAAKAQGVELAFAGGGSARGELAFAAGKLDARLDVKGLDLLAWHANLRPTALAGAIGAVATADAQSFTLDLADPRFRIAGAARLAKQVLEVERVRIERTGSAIEAAGRLALAGGREFSLQGRLVRVNPAHFAKLPEGDISGVLEASGALGDRREIRAVLDIAKGRFAGLVLEGRAEVNADAAHVGRIEASLAAGETRASASGAFGRAGDVLVVKVASPDLAPFGKAFGIGIAGRVEGDAHVEGTFAAPSGRLALRAADLVVPGGARVASVDARLMLGAAQGSPITGDVTMSGLRAGAGGGDEEAIVSRAVLTLRGTRAAHDIRLEASLPGDSTVRVLLAGGLPVAAGAAPQWRGRLEMLESTGRFPVTLVAPATLAVAPDRFELGEAKLSGEWGRIDLATTRWTPALAEAKGSARGLAVRTLTRLLRLRQAPSSNLVLEASWDLRAGDTLEGFAQLRRESGDVRVGEARLALGLETLLLRLDAEGSRVKAKAEVRGTQVGRWTAEGEAALRREASAWSLSPVAPVAGRLAMEVPDLAWTAGWLGPDAQAGGRLAGRVSLAGTARDPTWEGRIDGSGLVIRDPASGIEGRQGTIAIAFRDHEVRLEKLVFDAPWRPAPDAAKAIASAKRPALGSLTAEGAVNLSTRKGEVRVKSAAYPLTQLATRFLAMTGEVRAELDGALVSFTGDLRADAGWFGIPVSAAPTVSDDVVVDRGDAAPATAASERVRLDLRVNLGDHTYFTGRGLATRLAGSLRLAGDVGPGLRATGSIQALEGTYDAYGRKLAIERGALNFQGPVDNPALNVVALRKGLPVEAGVEILGNVARPIVRLVSFPDVPDPEKLAWLVLGRGQGQVAAGDASILVSAAGSILGRDTSRSGKLLEGLGLSPDDIRFGQEGGSLLGTLPQSTVAGRTGAANAQDVQCMCTKTTFDRRLTEDIYLSYQQGLADAQGSMRVAWSITRAFQLILRAGNQPGIDAVYRFSLDEPPIKLRRP
jgi:translocation and assembly module TamB